MLAIGDSDTMLEAAEFLEQLNESAAQLFAARTGLPVSQVHEMLREETLLSPDQAMELGFADKLLDRDADPVPKISEPTAPRSKRAFEDELRARLGFSKRAAARLAAGGWPAYGDEPQIDFERVLAVMVRNFTDLKKALRQGGR
jgi:hypothetical protein